MRVEANAQLDRALQQLQRMRGAGSERGDQPDFPCLLAVSEAPASEGGFDGVLAAFPLLRAQSTRDAVKPLGFEQGFRIEDLLALEIVHPPGADLGSAWSWIDRQIPAEVLRSTREEEGPVTLRAVLRQREGPPPAHPHYEQGPEGLIRVEAFELHVVEHCNLRCANCCNLSPFVDPHVLSVETVAEHCAEMAKVLHADVFKIMGGEPLLHPDLPGLLKAIRASGIGDAVRLFTNGLLLPSMPDAFWAALDQLTISNYQSAPVKASTLALVDGKAREYGFVVNTKPVDRFSQVLSPHYEASAEEVQRVYDACWLRHRCLIARRGRFYKCTRAAYAAEFHARIGREPPPADFSLADDGIELAAPRLGERLLTYLNTRRPLASCHYCKGGDGIEEAHHQLSRAQVREGVLSRTLSVPRE